MKHFLKPLYHSEVFWYGVLCIICCGMWGYHLTRLAGYNNSSAWMALAMVLIFIICATFSTLMLNGVELTEEYHILRHGLALRQPIAIASNAPLLSPTRPTAHDSATHYKKRG